MSKKNNYYKIGLFVLSAVLLVVISLFMLGLKSAFKDEWVIETYFDKSVQGLEVGSPVKYLGVKIGDVKDIGFVYETYKTEAVYVMVRLRINPAALGKENGEDTIISGKKLCRECQKEVKKGLRVRLAMQGITGIAYLELSYILQESVPPLPINWTPKTPYLPSAPNTLDRISSSAEKILFSLKATHFEQIGSNITQTLKTADSIMSNQVTELLVTLQQTALSIDQKLNTLSSKTDQLVTTDISRILSNTAIASDQLPDLIKKAGTAVDIVEAFLSNQQNEFDEIMENVRQTTDNLNDITENARQYPSSLFFGEPPRHPEVLEQP